MEIENNMSTEESQNDYNSLKRKLYIARILFHIPNFIKLSLRLIRDKRVSFYLKLLVYAAILYVISPFDLLPDFLLPFLGFFEDLLILIFCLIGLVKFSPPEVVKEHVQAIDIENKNRFKFFYRA